MISSGKSKLELLGNKNSMNVSFLLQIGILLTLMNSLVQKKDFVLLLLQIDAILP